MRFPLPVISRTLPVIVVFIVAALAATHRSGAAVNAGHVAAHPLTTSIVCPNSVFCYEVVNYNSSDNNYVTGINNPQDIVGAYSAGSSGPYGSFSGSNGDNPNALTSYSLLPKNDGSLSTYLAGLDDGNGDKEYRVGYVVNGLQTLGAVLFPPHTYGNNDWVTMSDPNQGTSPCAVTEVLSIFDSRIAVGYYETNGTGTACVKHAFEVYSNGNFTSPYTFVDLAPTDPLGNTLDVTSSQATGVNILGDVVGTVNWTQSGKALTGGWIYRDLKYTTFCLYPNGTSSHSCSSTSGGGPLATYANGINFSDDVVGNYTDTAGRQNGFVIVTPWKSPAPTFTTIDINPGGNPSNTVLSSINEGTGDKNQFFAGWFKPVGVTATSGIVGICRVKGSHCQATAGHRAPNPLNVERRELGKP